MCCFSRPVQRVANTNIFARAAKDERQYLVYGMDMSAKERLAMILPIPVPENSKEDAVRFINLEKYADFFKDMHAGFPEPPRPKAARASGSLAAAAPKLVVVSVGSLEASFVPSIKDFGRLDERFRLPSGVWEKLPAYKEFGFAVFKLKEGSNQVHPMAFEFPRANSGQLFFPTVHIHDGKVHAKAKFDHALYCQRSPDDTSAIVDWEESRQPAGLFMKIDKAQGVLAPDDHCYRRQIHGMQKNTDTVV